MSWKLSEKESEIKRQLEKADKIPVHIAVIMDGNGRWAKRRLLPRIAGHKAGIETVRDIVKVSSEMGIKHLTLYTFSTENWKRPKDEVSGLMKLLENYLRSEIEELNENNVRLTVIGDINNIPINIQKLLSDSIEKTRKNTGLNLNLALSYSGRWDIVEATKSIAQMVLDGKIKIDDIDDKLFPTYLSTKDLEEVDLLVRTSGELRISNFLLWDIAYSEIYITDKMWPEFSREDLCEALITFMNRNRRFGTLENN